MFPVGDEKATQREKKPIYPEVTVAERTGRTGDPLLLRTIRPKVR